MSDKKLSELNSDQKLAILRGVPRFCNLLGMMYQGADLTSQKLNALFIYDNPAYDLLTDDFEILVDVWGEALIGMGDMLLMVKAGNPDGLSAIVESTTDKIKNMMEQFKGGSNSIEG